MHGRKKPRNVWEQKEMYIAAKKFLFVVECFLLLRSYSDHSRDCLSLIP